MDLFNTHNGGGSKAEKRLPVIYMRLYVWTRLVQRDKCEAIKFATRRDVDEEDFSFESLERKRMKAKGILFG